MTIFNNLEMCAKIHKLNNEGVFCPRFKISDMPGKTMIHVMVLIGKYRSVNEARKNNFQDEPLVTGVHFFNKGRYLFELVE